MNERISLVRGQPRTDLRWLMCVALVPTLMLSLVVTGCSSQTKKRNPPILVKGANVNVGLIPDLPGLSVLYPGTTKWVGFQADLMDRMRGKLEVIPTPVPVTFEERIPRIEDGQVKVMLANFAMTDDRCKKVMCIGPYMTSENTAMTYGDDRIYTVDGMKGKSVCTMTGTTSLKKLNESLQGAIHIVEKPSLGDCVKELKEGKVKAVSTARIDLLGYTKDDPKLQVAEFDFGTEDRFAVALHKDAALQDCENVRKLLAEFIASTDWRQFFYQHFPGQNPEPHRPKVDAVSKCPTE